MKITGIEFVPDFGDPSDDLNDLTGLFKEAHDWIDRLKRELGWIVSSIRDDLFDDQRKQALLHHICALHDIIDDKPIGTYQLAYTAGWAALNEDLKHNEQYQEFLQRVFGFLRSNQTSGSS
jgi:hypothetical protein